MRTLQRLTVRAEDDHEEDAVPEGPDGRVTLENQADSHKDQSREPDEFVEDHGDHNSANED